MAGKEKLILTLAPTPDSTENAVYAVMRAAQMEALRQRVTLQWHTAQTDPV